MVFHSAGEKYCIARSYHCGHSEPYGIGGTKSRPSITTCDLGPADTFRMIDCFFDESPVDSSTDLAIAKVPDIKQKSTAAVNTRRTRGKRWGYEGIKTRFRGVKIVYPSKLGLTNFYEQMFVFPFIDRKP
jgi:hypothetical protein